MSGSEVPQHYWKKLLEFSTVAGGNEVDTSGQPIDISDEKKEFLEKALSDMVAKTDPSKQLDIALESLRNFSSVLDLDDEILSKIEEVADSLMDLLLFADLTQKFEKHGGFTLLKNFMDPKYPVDIQNIFVDCIITVADNNIPGQEETIKSGLLESMLKDVQNSSRNKSFRLKLLSAVSATVRSHVPALEEFLKLEGNRVFESLFNDKEISIAAKATRVLASIAFTFDDNVIYRHSLSNEICKGYMKIVQSREAAIEDEIAYVRAHVQQYIKPSDVSDETRLLFVSSLEEEKKLNSKKEEADGIQSLIKKFKSL